MVDVGVGMIVTSCRTSVCRWSPSRRCVSSVQPRLWLPWTVRTCQEGLGLMMSGGPPRQQPDDVKPVLDQSQSLTMTKMMLMLMTTSPFLQINVSILLFII